MSKSGAAHETANSCVEGWYRVYTERFDVVTPASQLAAHLGPLDPHDRARLNEAWRELQAGLAPWRTRLQLLASEADARIRAALPEDVRASTIVSLLIDQSGSMRGQKMLFAAAATDIVQEFLLTLGLRCEVLGFTTVRWHGGRSRRRWRWRLRRPSRPGRLNDLLHIVYKDAEDSRASTGGPSFKEMLRHDLPKENIDGEALLWASERLRARPEDRKLLVVLSDGAPVDDSTLLENGTDYLANHLREVIKALEAAGDIALAALGIGYAVDRYYSVSAHAEAPADVGEALLRLVERLLLREAGPGAE